MRRLIALSLLAVFVASSASAGPLRDSAQKAAQASTTPPRTAKRSAELYWGGVAVAGAGGWLLGWGLGEKHQVTCIAVFGVLGCEETGANRGTFIGSGLAVMGTGIAMSAWGGRRVVVAPSLRGVTGTIRF